MSKSRFETRLGNFETTDDFRIGDVSRNDDDWKSGCVIVCLVLAIIAGGFLVTMGPAGIATRWSAWRANAYGSDWYVIHYLPDGTYNEFHLKDTAIHSESGSDGIFFQWEGSTVHLSTYYEYVQHPSERVVAKLRGAGKKENNSK